MAKRVEREPGAGPSNASMLLGDQLCFALYSASHAIQRIYRPLLDPLGLTYPQYLVLLVLWEDDRLSVSELGDRLMLNSATLTPLLKRMEARGLVERQRSSVDERRVMINLTENAKELQDDVRLVTDAVTCAASDASSDAAELHRRLVQLRESLTAGRDD